MENVSLPEKLDRKIICESDWISLYADKIKLPNGHIIDTHYNLHYPHELVCIVIINKKNEFLMIQSKRYVTNQFEWEIPVGRIENNETPEEAAKRECLEETGCILKDLTFLCYQNPNNGMSDLKLYVFMAKVETDSADFDKNEINIKQWVKKEKVIEMLKNNDIHCSVSMLALLYAMQFYS